MYLLVGLSMGLVYASAPGPVNVETLRRGMKSGFMESLAVQTGASVGRIVYALLALLGAGLLLQGETVQLTIGVFGMTVLFYLGISAIRDWRGLLGESEAETAVNKYAHHAFLAGATLSLANPLAIVFWLSIGSQMIHSPRFEGTSFLAGFFFGCILVSLFASVFASYWQTRLTKKIALTISWVCGLLLIGFGLKLGYTIGAAINFW